MSKTDFMSDEWRNAITNHNKMLEKKLSDTQILGVDPSQANTCLYCGACLPDDVTFQELHMFKEHNLEV